MGDTEQPTLSFDRAAYEAASPSATPCSSCKAPLDTQYWKLGSHVLCAKCRGSFAASFAKAKTAAAFGKAALLGGLSALGCGVGYAVLYSATHTQFALVTIGIAYVVATVVRRASGGFSGRRFQVLAVALTYVASTMGYLPAIVSGGIAASAIPQVVGIMLAAPFLELGSSPLGFLIVAFGLWSAWRRSRAVAPEIEGPFRVSA